MAKALPSLRRAPWIARMAMGPVPRQYRRDPAAAFEKQFGRDLPECDRRALEDPAARASLLEAAVESTRQGSRPLAVEMQLAFSRPWGFEPSSVSVPTHLWYGEDDTLTPPQMGRYLAQQIPGATLTVFPGEGHMAAFTHWDEVVGRLVAAG
jgi:pimeloyl-ACP methyl ester carboxylesterase